MPNENSLPVITDADQLNPEATEELQNGREDDENE